MSLPFVAETKIFAGNLRSMRRFHRMVHSRTGSVLSFAVMLAGLLAFVLTTGQSAQARSSLATSAVNSVLSRPLSAIQSADLSVTNSDIPDPVTQGSPLTYTVTIVNNGPDTVQTVLLTDTMPAGASFNFATINQGSCGIAFPLLACQLGSINSGGSVVLTIRMTPNSPGTITNHAVATTATTDPNIANNSASQDTTVIALQADLSVTNSDTPDPVTQGSPLTYTVTIVNNGPDTAQTVLLTDTLPAGASFNFATINQGSCGIAFPLLACQLGSINSGGSVVLTIRMTPNCPARSPTTSSSPPLRATRTRATMPPAQTTTVQSPIVLSPTSLPGGMEGVPYNQTISASNGAVPYTFAVASGALPPGLTLSAAGLLSGTPTTVGSFSFSVTATDANGSTGSQSYTIIITYNFTGFFQPVDNLPALNIARAGSATPIKFNLGGDQGLSIFAAGYPVARPIACDSSAPLDPIEETATAGSSGLSYDPVTNTYTYVWKTVKSWSGTCRQLIVRFSDGTDHVANFKFN